MHRDTLFQTASSPASTCCRLSSARIASPAIPLSTCSALSTIFSRDLAPLCRRLNFTASKGSSLASIQAEERPIQYRFLSCCAISTLFWARRRDRWICLVRGGSGRWDRACRTWREVFCVVKLSRAWTLVSPSGHSDRFGQLLWVQWDERGAWWAALNCTLRSACVCLGTSHFGGPRPPESLSTFMH